MEFTYTREYVGNIKAVIFDWAGTTVDYGCFAPAGNFIEVFKRNNVDVSFDEARAPMGLHKKDHIRVISQMPRVAAQWLEKNGKAVTEEDIESMFQIFIPLQLQILPQYSELIPGVVEVVDELRDMGIKIGSTTGYNTEMMEIVKAEAKKQGYAPDCLVCASEVPAGRPAPYMIYKNAMELDVYPMEAVVKVGDTTSDIEEGLNAGAWSVGVVLSSNEMGLTHQEIIEMPYEELERRKEIVRKRYLQAGADYVIDTLEELPELIEIISLNMNSY